MEGDTTYNLLSLLANGDRMCYNMVSVSYMRGVNVGAMSLGQRIREVRLGKKLTQNDVVGDYMTRNMLSKIENGSATPSVRTLEFLAVALDVPISYFLDGGDGEAVDTEQLREIDELALGLIPFDDKRVAGLSLCIRARTRLAAGRPDAALSVFDGFDPADYPLETVHSVYAVKEDCYRIKGDYRLAYEYALKRLGEYNDQVVGLMPREHDKTLGLCPKPRKL